MTANYIPVLTAVSGPTGLIIDAFGELRDQQEQVREDMEVCFSIHIFQFRLQSDIN